MEKIRITADSTCDISPALRDRYGFEILPLFVGLGETYGKDGEDVTPDDIYRYVTETRTLPKTAARSASDYESFFRRYTEKGETVIHFNISSEMSCSYQNACLAAEEIGGGVHVVDSRNLSTGIALLMLDAARLREAGKSAAEIAQSCRNRTGLVRASFVVDTLEYLRMGGRCSSVAALGANLLKLHPCIEVADGAMRVGTKYRGPLSKVIVQYVKDKLTKTPNIDPTDVFITHTQCDPAVVHEVRQAVESTGLFEHIYETDAGATICSHCGSGTLGVLFEIRG